MLGTRSDGGLMAVGLDSRWCRSSPVRVNFAGSILDVMFMLSWR